MPESMRIGGMDAGIRRHDGLNGLALDIAGFLCVLCAFAVNTIFTQPAFASSARISLRMLS